MSWYWKRKPTWRKDLITCNSHSWIMFSFKWLVIIWRGGLVWNWRPRSRRGKNFVRRWTRVLRGLENWTIFMDVICVSPLTSSEIVCYTLFACGHYFVQYGFMYIYIFYLFLWTTSVSSSCAFLLFCLLCVEFRCHLYRLLVKM